MYTRFFDGDNILEVQMLTEQGINFAEDFFNVGGLAYDDEIDAHIVDDCGYLIEVLEDYKNSEGDYYECGMAEDHTEVFYFLSV